MNRISLTITNLTKYHQSLYLCPSRFLPSGLSRQQFSLELHWFFKLFCHGVTVHHKLHDTRYLLF